MFTVHVRCNSIDKQTKIRNFHTHTQYLRTSVVYDAQDNNKKTTSADIALYLMTHFFADVSVTLNHRSCVLTRLLAAAAAAADGWCSMHTVRLFCLSFLFISFSSLRRSFVRIAVAVQCTLYVQQQQLHFHSSWYLLHVQAWVCVFAPTSMPRWRTKDSSCCC